MRHACRLDIQYRARGNCHVPGTVGCAGHRQHWEFIGVSNWWAGSCSIDTSKPRLAGKRKQNTATGCSSCGGIVVEAIDASCGCSCCVMFDSSAITSGTCICEVVVFMWQLVSSHIVIACMNSSSVPGRPACDRP